METPHIIDRTSPYPVTFRHRWAMKIRMLVHALPRLAIAIVVINTAIYLDLSINWTSVSCMILLPVFAIYSIALQQLWAFLYLFGTGFFSYLRLSPNGIEICQWPKSATKATWQNVRRLGKKPSWGASYHQFEMANFETLEQSRLARLVELPLKLFKASDAALKFTFASFTGWPNGELEAQVRTYAPHLFEDLPEQIGPPYPQ